MKRLFKTRLYQSRFDRPADYQRVVTDFGGDTKEEAQWLKGDSGRLDEFRKAMTAAGFQEVVNPRESGGKRYHIGFEVQFEEGDWNSAEIFVLSASMSYLYDNAEATSRTDVRINVSDERLWDIKDVVIDQLYGDAPALFTSVKGLLLANEALRLRIANSDLRGFEFVDGVKLEGENTGKVKQKLWVIASNVTLPPVEPDVMFVNDKRETLPNKDIVGMRLWSGETVIKYRRPELAKAGFEDAGEMAEGKRPTSLMAPLLISRKAFEFFRDAGVPLDCYPALVV